MAFMERPMTMSFHPGAVWMGARPGALWLGARSLASRRLGKFLLGAALLHVGFKLYGRYKRNQRRLQWRNAGKDVVVLHQFHRGTNMPNLSPFALKLETFLRMAKIQYVVDFDEPQHEKTMKCPWITINGTDMYDSEIIMDYLTHYFKHPLKEALTPSEHAVGRAVQVMLDEHSSWIIFYKRYVLDRGSNVFKWFSPKIASRYIFIMWPLFFHKLKKFFYMVGVGRLTEQQAMFFLHRELRALADILADKPFLLSETPTSYDAAVFSELTQVLYGCAPEVERQVRASYDSLAQYHERMKERFWQDWDQCHD